MKFVKVAIGVVLVGGLAAGTAPAQMNAVYPTQSGYAYPSAPVQQVAYANNGYLFAAPGEASISPSDMAVASDYNGCNSCSPAASCGSSCGSSCSSGSGCGFGRGSGCGFGCGSGGGCSQSCLGDPWSLFGQTCTGLTAGGWISVGGYANDHNNANNGPLGFNALGNGFTMNQLWGFIDKPIDTGGCGWDIGGRIDYVFGVDGQDTQAFGDVGWDNGWNSSRDYGSAIPQAYVEIGLNHLSVKAGHFFTPIGYEVVQAPENFFYSHAYTMYYGEPFTHTGALATYAGFDNWTLYGGWTAGWDTGFNNSGDASTFLGGATYSLCDNASITYMLSAGNWGNFNGGNICMHSIVMELALMEDLTWVIQNDLGIQSDVPGGDRRWGGINQYLLYEISECWGLGFRFEWFNDREGSRGIGPAGNYYNCTAGVNWRPHANFVFRPEIRVDWFGGETAAGTLPFNSGRNHQQLSGGFDAILTF